METAYTVMFIVFVSFPLPGIPLARKFNQFVKNSIQIFGKRLGERVGLIKLMQQHGNIFRLSFTGKTRSLVIISLANYPQKVCDGVMLKALNSGDIKYHLR